MQSGSLRKHGVRSFDKMSKLARPIVARISRVTVPKTAAVAPTEQAAAMVFASCTASGAGRAR